MPDTGLRIKVALARAAGAMSRASRRGGGTSFPGRLLLRMDPRAIGRLAGRLERGAIVVSATNGKTTTAGMIAAILRQAGLEPVHNRAGANMPGGVATALLEQTGGDAAEPGIGLFEVDEAWLRQVVDDLSPHTALLGNLFRDQLDRYGELEKLADEWSALVAERGGRTSFVLNADDPLVADLGRDRAGTPRERVSYFGLEDRSHALERIEHASDAKHCRRCGTAYTYAAAYLGHLGVYECPHCGNARPAPSVAARAVELRGMAGSRFTLSSPAGVVDVSLRLPGLYNVYNATAAAACCLEVGATLEQVERGLESFSAAFGRAEEIDLGNRRMAILLVKNPAGANEVFRTVAAADGQGELDLWMVLNDRIADGRDISWIWDADFETLAPRAGRVVCSGTRAEELALRLKYAGVGQRRLEVIPSLERGFDRALAGSDDRTLYALPTYTALLELRDVLAGRGYAPPFWE
ncbi:MAG: MurT ligase domain-containing protein [Solirubrobacterales bacterium]